MRSRILVKMLIQVFLAGYFVSCTSPKYAAKPSIVSSASDSVKTSSLGEFELQGKGKEKSIDMEQFRRKALNIPYAGSTNARQTLDIIYPPAGEAPYKFIVVFHGGGWAFGDKQSESIAPIFQAVNQGYAVVSVNYRLSDEVTWPKPLHDAKAAIRYLRANAFRHLLEASNMIVWGIDAGGHIAEMLAATNNQPAYEDLILGNPTASSAVQGVVTWYGVSDLGELTDALMLPANKIMGFDVRTNKTKARSANPIDLVTKNFPPILFVHGTKDQFVPFSQSVNMQQKVNETVGRMIATLKRYEGAAYADPVIRTAESVSNDLDFVDKILFDGKNPGRNRNYVPIKIGG